MQVGLVALVLVVGAAAVIIAWREERDAAATDERVAAQQSRDVLSGVGRQIEASLAGSAGLVRADSTFNTAAFERFAIELADASDLTALAFEPVVWAADREAFEARVGEIIDRGPERARRAPLRLVHYPVEVVAPESELTEGLVGFDLQGDTTRREAAELALQTGRLIVSDPVASEPTGAPSFFVIKALFAPDDGPAAGRHVGFISTAFPGARVGEILMANLPPGTRFRVSDDDAVLASTDPAPDGGQVASVDIAGQTWQVTVDGAMSTDFRVAWLLGLVTLLLVAGMIGSFRRTDTHNRMLDETAHRAEQLAELAQRLNAAGTVDEVAEVVTTFGREPVHAAAASLGVIVRGELDVRHGETVPEEYRVARRVIPLDAPLGFAVAAATGEALRFEDQAAYDAGFPAAGGPTAGARAFHPIRRADGTTIGAIAHLWSEPQPFDDILVSTLRTIADLTGQAVERARLAEVTAREAHSAEELARMAEELASRTSSEDVTTFLTRAVLPPLGADHAAVAVIDGARLRRAFTPGPITDLLREVLPESVPLEDDSPLAQVARTGEMVLMPDEAALRARYPHLAEGWIGLGFQATANLPLRDRDGALIGALGVAWNTPIDPADLLDRLATVAGIAGQTLDRARLVDRVTAQARRSDAMATLAEVLATARSAAEVADAVADHAAPVVDAVSARLALGDEAVLDPPAATVLALRDSAGREIGRLGFDWAGDVVEPDLPRIELRSVADLCAPALERATLAEAEHRLALTLQDNVLRPLPQADGLAGTARYLPAGEPVGIGGDWFEGILRPEGRYLVIVGDVAGHGVNAVAQMAQLRASIGTLARLDVPVEEILPQVSAAGRREDVAVATAALVEIDAADGSLRYACAGHPPPMVRMPSGEVVVLDDGRLPLLGMPMDVAEAGAAAFPPGAVLLCYTDGLIERRDEPIDASISQLAVYFSAIPGSDVDELADAIVERWRRQDRRRDDVALAVVANEP